MNDVDRVLKVYGDFREDVARIMVKLQRGTYFEDMPLGDQLGMAAALRELIHKYPGTGDLEDELKPKPVVIDEDYLCTTRCGCYVELDGYCEHGNPSNALEMGMV